MLSRARQQALPLRTWGGKRAGAGRKPRGARAGVPHRARPVHDRRHPVHLTLRTVATLPNLREARLFPTVRDAIARSSRPAFRVVQFSVQRDHLHLLVEAGDRVALYKGAKGLAVRLAHAINRRLGRKGQVLGDRYHARALMSPRAVRQALVYVLNNARKHHQVMQAIDLCSSAPWFADWAARVPAWYPRGAPCPVVPARTWLLREGWRRWGPIQPEERPGRTAKATSRA